MLSGRTRQGKLVHFAPPAGATLEPGTFATVLIDRGGPHHLAGDLVAGRRPSRDAATRQSDPRGRRLTKATGGRPAGA